MMRQIAITTAIILATLAGVTVIITYPEAVIMFLATLAIAAAARPLVDKLIDRGLKRGLAVLVTFVGIFAVLILLLVIIIPLLINDLTQLSDKFVVTYDYIYLNWPNGSTLQQAVANRLPPPAALYDAIAGEQGSELARNFIGWTANIFATVGQFLAILVLSIYWTIDRIYFERLWLSLLPVVSRAHWRAIGRDIEVDLGAYIRSELAQSLLAGVLLGLGYGLIGLPYPALMAVFVASVWLIPWLGAPLGVLGIVLHGVLTGNLLITAAAGIYTGVVLLVMQVYVEPRIFKRRQFNSWIIILFLMALGETFGLIGLIIAPPLATATLIIFRRVLAASAGTSGAEADTTPASLESARQIASLESRVKEVRQLIAGLDEQPSPQTANMLDRLGALVVKANLMLDETYPAASATTSNDRAAKL